MFTIGHSNRTFTDFINLLKQYNIDILVDIRGGENPGSRAFPHFNKSALMINIIPYGVQYIHIPDLGGRRNKCKLPQYDPTINSGWEVRAFKNYADYAYFNQSFADGLELLIKIGQSKNVAYMCSEAVPWRCHRRIVTDYLKCIYNIPITHILSKTQTLHGRMNNNFGSVENGKMAYRK